MANRTRDGGVAPALEPFALARYTPPMHRPSVSPHAALLTLAFALGCAAPPPVPAYPTLDSVPSLAEAPAPTRTTLSVIGTNDIHGHMERLAHFGGMLANLREARDADGGAVVLLDGGDMWQGTLASNLDEGASMVRLFNLLGYDAVTVGNHEFDYGPVGPSAVPTAEGEDPRGALLARAAEARFPFLAANYLDAETGAPVAWENVRRTVIIEKAGLKIGLIGLSTEDTLTTTIAANVRDLRMAPLAPTITELAAELRAAGANAVVAAVHAGGHCRDFDDPDDLSSCDSEQEIFRVARELAPGTVDAIIAGHTHRGVAHRVNGTPVIEAFATGRAFGRVDLVFEGGRVVDSTLHAPRFFCPAEEEAEACPLGEYEGAPVALDAEVAAVVTEASAAAAAREAESLGVVIAGELGRSYTGESPLGNLFADLLAEARPRADVALLNAGGVREVLPEGTLTYGALYRAFPFDNRFATIRLTVAQAREVFRYNLGRDDGSLLVAGVRVEAQCRGDELVVMLRDRRGRVMRDDRVLTIATSDYLATTPLFAALPEGAITLDDGPPIREVYAELLRRRGGTLDPARLYDRERPRTSLPSARPIRCGE